MLARSLRLTRILRLLRLLRASEWLESYQLLVHAMKASIGALFWTLALLLTRVCLVSFILSQVFRSYFDSDDVKIDMFQSFGTFTRVLLTMFEMTLGNFGPPTWIVFEHVHEAWMVVLLAYKLIAGFAMLNVIMSVFM